MPNSFFSINQLASFTPILCTFSAAPFFKLRTIICSPGGLRNAKIDGFRFIERELLCGRSGQRIERRVERRSPSFIHLYTLVIGFTRTKRNGRKKQLRSTSSDKLTARRRIITLHFFLPFVDFLQDNLQPRIGLSTGCLTC